MVQRHAILALYLAVCLVHAIYTTVAAAHAAQWPHILVNAPLFVGGAASLAAMLVGILVVMEAHGPARTWLKAALTLQVVAPFAWWTIYMPASANLVCIDACWYSDAEFVHLKADLVQAQMAIAVVAWASLFCAAKTATATLEELAT